MINKFGVGKFAEDYALSLYQKQGFVLVKRNEFNHKGKQLGEIDFIVYKNRQLVFVEVKARSNIKYGTPQEFVDKYKQNKLIKTAKWFLATHPNLQNLQPQFDVIAIMIDKKAVEALDIDKIIKSVIIISNTVEVND